METTSSRGPLSDEGPSIRVKRTSTILRSADHLEQLWESRVGRALRRLGLRSVRTTILTLAMLATLIPSLATSWISYRQNRRALEANLEQQLRNASHQSAREVGLWLKGRLYDLRVFAASYEVIEGIERDGAGSRRLREYLASVDERFADYQELLVVAPDQRVIASSARAPRRLAFAGNWIQQARDGDPVLGAPQRADSAAPVAMEVAVPIISANGRFLGVLAARLVFSGIAGPLRELLPTGDARLIVATPDGQVISATRSATRSATTGVPEATIRQLLQAEGAIIGYDAPDGVAMLARLADIPSSEWMAIAEIPATTAFADIRDLRTKTIATVLVLLLVVGGFAYGLGLLIVLPLERLSNAAALVAGGDLDVDVPTTGGGEVSQLATVFNDMVRRLREGRAELERLSVTDALTGLANRRRLTTELEREVQRSDRHERTFAVLMLDVDKFKHFNDTYGHPAGDAVLKRLAEVLHENARSVDTVARYGGEEFTLILPETDAAAATAIAERIRATAESDRFTPDGAASPTHVTLSIGVAVFPVHARVPEGLVQAADQALYRSKEAGRNRVTVAAGETSEPPKPRKRKGG